MNDIGKRRFCFGVFLLAFCVLNQHATAQSGLPDLRIKLQRVAEGFTSPVGLMAPDDGSSRIFVIEQSGKIKIIKNGIVLPVPFLTLTPKLDGLNIAYS